MTNKIDPEIAKAIISKYLSNSDGRNSLFKAMVDPIRRSRDYQSVGRRTFLVENIYKYNCSECGMGWDEDDHVHSDIECCAALIHNS